MVTKQVDPADRRGRLLSLSPAGRTLLMRDPLAETVAAIRRLSGPQRTELARGLESILSSRLDARKRKPFGQCRDCRHFARRHAGGAPHYCRLLDEPLEEEKRTRSATNSSPPREYGQRSPPRRATAFVASPAVGGRLQSRLHRHRVPDTARPAVGRARLTSTASAVRLCTRTLARTISDRTVSTACCLTKEPTGGRRTTIHQRVYP